jgi:hypothetical protein
MEANYQYVPLAPELLQAICSYVAPAPHTAHMVDICAGTGAAAAGMAEAWQIARDRLYLNELVDGRKAQCAQYSDHVLGADAIRSLQVSASFFQVWLTNRGTLNHLARCYDRVTMVALPEEHRHYREVLAIGVVRATERAGQDMQARARQIAEKLAGDLPVLERQPQPRYSIPAPLKLQRQLIWRDANAATPEQAQADVLAIGGAWSSRSHRGRLHAARQDRRRIRPIFPLGKVAAALRVAEGDINNMLVTINDRPVRIKGSTRKTNRTWQEERAGSDGATVIDTHRMELREPVVVTLDSESAAITRYSGDAGIAALMDIPDAAQSLLDAVAQSAPPIYAMQLPPNVADILQGIVSASGRALPGYAPGYIPMQQHIIAASYLAFRDPDPHTGKYRKVIGLGADMGCGKSGIAAGTAEVLRQLLPTHRRRAYTTLVIAPNHLIGELAQVLAHDQALPGIDRPPLPQWIGEWRDLLPHWHSTILETPAQVSAFYAGANADPTTPRVGFLAFSKFSLNCGWEVAVTTHRPAPAVPTANPDEEETPEQQRLIWRAAFYQRLKDEERREWDELKQREKAAKKRQNTRQAQRVAHANGESTRSSVDGPGVSERTRRRDRLFRCGNAYRETLKGAEPKPLWHFDGVFCPDCGRRVRSKDGVPHTRETLRKAGMVHCPFCGGVLGQQSRKQDNVSDRALPIFNDPTYRNSYAMEVDPRTGEARRAIPWGQRPTSNPRMALGDFIIARGYAQQTDFVITDEFHAMKGRSSARGRIWGRLLRHAHRSEGLTGSPYGGKASTAYWMLQRMDNVFVRREFRWDEEKEFVERLGILDTITSQVVEEEAQAFSGKRNAAFVRVEERNGLTAELAAIMQSQFIFILLRQMGFLLPPYHEGVVFFDLPDGLAEQYARLVSEGKAIIKEPGGKDALSSYLQSTLTYCMAPWKPVTVRSKHTGEAYCPPAFPTESILPHHRWLAQRAAEQTQAGRGMLVFAEHTNKLDILADLQTKIQQLALSEHGTTVKVAILRSTTVKPGARGAWFAERERDGTNVVLCHPGLVETGMNLIAWPEIVFAEPTYSLYRAMQARKRALRPTQTRACNVTWLGYYETMIEQALDIIGSKATAATLLNGDDLSSGLMQMDPGMSLLQELARRVLHDEVIAGARETIAARLEDAGAALKASMEIGAHDLVGVTVDQMVRPDPTLRPVSPITSTPAIPTQSLPALLPLTSPTPALPPLLVAAAGTLDTGFLSPLNDVFTVPQPASASGDYLTWNEVVVRQRRKGKGRTAADDNQQAVQFSFVAD